MRGETPAFPEAAAPRAAAFFGPTRAGHGGEGGCGIAPPSRRMPVLILEGAGAAGALGALAAFAAGAAATRGLARRGPRRWLVDRPNERSLHERLVSRAGGLGVLAGIAAGLAIATRMEAPAAGHGWVLGGALVIVLVSFADDLRPLSPAIRIVSHLAAAVCTVLAGLSADRIVLPGVVLALGPGRRRRVHRPVRGVDRESV